MCMDCLSNIFILFMVGRLSEMGDFRSNPVPVDKEKHLPRNWSPYKVIGLKPSYVEHPY